MSFFGTAWEDMTEFAVEGFLSDAGDEGLIWEAKGGTEPHRRTVHKAVCGLANAEGGFLILGAERRAGGAWTLPGVEFRSTEPGVWLSSLITSGLNPAPRFDIRTFSREEGRVAAVVAVETVAIPPCVTSSGAVYQRVVGQTLPVTDQRVLADLVARGRTAREQTEAVALRAGLRALEEPAAQPPADAMLSVAICPSQGADDKAAALFTKTFAARAADIV
jgi:hypothetical protein